VARRRGGCRCHYGLIPGPGRIPLFFCVPAYDSSIKKPLEAELEKEREAHGKARDEAGLMQGVIVGTYGRDAKTVIEGYRRKR